MKKITIKEVAKAAGVSIATVSRVLNSSGGYSDETCRMIEETMRKLGYQPNSAARALKSKQSNLLGFMLPVAQTTSLERILYAFEREAEQAGYQVIVCRAGGDPAQMAKRIRILSGFQVDGIAFCSHQPSEAFDRVILASHVPSVLIANFSATGKLPSIRTDDFAGAYAAAAYLYERGHRRFAFLVGPKDDTTAGMSRLNGYRQALIDRGIGVDKRLIFYGDFGFQNARRAAKDLVGHRKRFTAVLAASDDMATAVLSESYEAGVHIPNEFSIIGYDDIVTAQMAIPPLSTMAQPFEELGRQAVQMLIEEITAGRAPEPRVLPIHVVERKTVRALT